VLQQFARQTRRIRRLKQGAGTDAGLKNDELEGIGSPTRQQRGNRLGVDVRHLLERRCQHGNPAPARDQFPQMRSGASLENRYDFGFHTLRIQPRGRFDCSAIAPRAASA
jgi:hypothetical protein